MDRPKSPEPSCVSVKSDQSLDPPLRFKRPADVSFKSDPPEPSCLSTKTDQSLDPSPNKKMVLDFSSIQMDRSEPPEPSCVSVKSAQSLDPPLLFKRAANLDFRSEQVQGSDPPEPSCLSMKSDQSPPLLFKTPIDVFLSLDSQCPEPLNTFRSNLQKKFKCLYEGIAKQGNPTLLNEIYTELYITESESGEISCEHEVRQIETQSWRDSTEDTSIICSDILKPLSAQDKPIRTVLTKGVAGIGKTVSVQKFVLDWAEGKENQDVQLIFPLPFRELNLMKDKQLSLLDLLYIFFPELKENDIVSEKFKVVFIFDGLDECRLPLDFHSSVRLCNVSKSASVDVLLTNLIKGNLLPSALIWITSRPAAADLIPSEHIDRVTEVRGFNDLQKDEYFRKRISDEMLARRILRHLRSSRSLYIMCHIPVFCWISATVLERMLSETESGEIPQTLTQMYTHFLTIQTNIKHEKDYEKTGNDKDMIIRLGKLAFEQLVKGNLIFYEEDLRECGIDVAEASVYSGLCTQIFKEEFGLYCGKVYCFVHLSIQEHLAALYVLFSFLLYKRDVLFEYLSSTHASEFTSNTISELHQRAVDEALQSKNGHLDLFLRFLLGLSLESNQTLLQDLLLHTGNISWSKEETVKCIKSKIRLNLSPDKYFNLFHCLSELGDQSLLKKVQKYIKYGNLLSSKFSASQWSAAVFVLLTSEESYMFQLSKYIDLYANKHQITPDEVLLKLLPAVKASKSANLSDCGLSDKCCADLVSVLGLKSGLKELNLSQNKLGGLGLKYLSAGLENPSCKVEKLELSDCDVTDEGCASLAAALRSNSHLRYLNLSFNKLGGSGVKLLSAGLENPDCALEKLGLFDCDVTDEGCAGLAAALRSNSHLRYLNLSKNKLGGSGVKLLSAGLENTNCKLTTLELNNCDVTDEGCAGLAAALRSNSHLRYLDLSNNKLGGSGVKLLSAGLENPDCALEKLWLNNCDVTDEGCAGLAEALRSNSHLRYLDLSSNKLGSSGVKLLSAGLENTNCALEKLWLNNCDVTDEGCAGLAAALRSNSHLRYLNLSNNKLGGSGVKLLSAGLENPDCELEKLWLNNCDVTDEGCAGLAAALRSNSYLRYLDLSNNKLGGSGVKLLSAGLENPDCELEKLNLSYCGVSDEGCAALAAALRSNPSHLTELDLSHNNLEYSEKQLLSDLRKDPHYKLKTLDIWDDNDDDDWIDYEEDDWIDYEDDDWTDYEDYYNWSEVDDDDSDDDISTSDDDDDGAPTVMSQLTELTNTGNTM